MSKKNIVIGYDSFKKCRIFRLLKGRRRIHETYGLWICNTVLGGNSPAYTVPNPRYFEFYCISHLFKGEGWYWTEKSDCQTIHTGQGVIVNPKLVQDYTAVYGRYNEDAICFCGPVADQLFSSGILKEGILNIGEIRRLKPIIELAVDPANDSQIKANLALQTLITELYFENRQKNNNCKYSKLDHLLQEILKNPEKWWTVEEMAELCNFSLNHFRRVFQNRVGIKPKRYIDELKIKKAAEYLGTTEDTIGEIAERFGFNDPFHFSRRFKDITGVSPDHYRKVFL